MKIRFGGVIYGGSIAHAMSLEKAGFDSLWIYDHLMHWSHKHGERLPELCPMSLAILPLILDKTNIPVGTSVICPLFRYHPAIVAQYFAQLDHLWPGRLMLGVGTGEAMNEAPLLGYWPAYKERSKRLIEAINVIKRLWTSDHYINYEGEFYRLQNLKLLIRPKKEIPIIISAAGPKSALIAGKYGDGIITMGATPERIKNAILPNFVKGATDAGKTVDESVRMAYILGGVIDHTVLGRILKGLKRSLPWLNPRTLDEPDPRTIDEMAEAIPDEQIFKVYPFVSEVDDLIDFLEAYIEAGINYIVFYDFTTIISRNPHEVHEMWSKKIFPYFKYR